MRVESGGLPCMLSIMSSAHLKQNGRASPSCKLRAAQSLLTRALSGQGPSSSPIKLSPLHSTSSCAE